MYTAKKFDHLLGTTGFSDTLLKNHFTLYEGYVTNFNKLNDLLVTMEEEGKVGTPVDSELNRRFGWEFNGMRLHELYFENIGKSGSQLGENGLKEHMIKEWGTMEAWEKDFRTMAAMRGIGWIIVYYDACAKRLFNVWVNEHDMGHFAGCVPLLVMDVFEHAYITDYGIKRADYIESYMKAIDWSVVEQRYENSNK